MGAAVLSHQLVGGGARVITLMPPHSRLTYTYDCDSRNRCAGTCTATDQLHGHGPRGPCSSRCSTCGTRTSSSCTRSALLPCHWPLCVDLRHWMPKSLCQWVGSGQGQRSPPKPSPKVEFKTGAPMAAAAVRPQPQAPG